MLVDGTDNKEYLCPVCRDKAMVHMLGELRVTIHLYTPVFYFRTVGHHKRQYYIIYMFYLI